MRRLPSLSSCAILLYRQVAAGSPAVVSSASHHLTSAAAVHKAPSFFTEAAYPTCNPRAQSFSTTTIMADLGATTATASSGSVEAGDSIVVDDTTTSPAPTAKEAGEQQQSSARGKTAPAASDESKTATEPEPEKKLPPLSPAEFRIYNRMADNMDYFHNHYRNTWNLLYTACTTNSRPRNMSIKQFISTGLQFCSSLTTHHGLEERHVFPFLARRMPEFKNGPRYKGAAELLRQHKEIHDGLDGFEEYLAKCQAGEADFSLRELKTKMDVFGEVLWKHLDQEVVTLGAENMRRYWTLDEMRRMPV